MHDTSFEPDPRWLARLAKGYDVREGEVDAETPAREHAGRGYKVATGPMYSTVDDLARFVGFQLGGGPEHVLSRKMLDEVLERRGSSRGRLAWGYGIGIQAARRGDFVARGHYGVVAGCTAAAHFDLDSGLGIIVLRNVSGGAMDVLEDAIQCLKRMAAVRPLQPRPPVR